MAVTKLLRIKQTKGSEPSCHLRRNIDYICNPKKTDGGLWISGNAGSSPEAIYRTMEVGRIMAANEQKIERPPLLIQKTRSLVFAEHYRELVAALKGEDKADAAAFRMFFDSLSGDGGKAVEAVSEIESARWYRVP